MEDKEIARKRAIAIAKAKAASAAKAKQAEEQAAAATSNKYTSIAQETQPTDPWAMTMAPSETGLDVGTDESKKALYRNVLEGISLGGAGELEAAVRSVGSDRSYGDILDQIEMEQRQYRQAQPAAATVQELGGTVFSPANLLKTPAAVAQYGTKAKTAFQAGVPAATYGFLGTEGDLEERAQGAAAAGAFGVLGGVAIDKLGNKMIQLNKRNKITPTVETLKAQENAAWDKVDKDAILFNRQDMDMVLQEASDVAKKYNYVTVKGGPTQVEQARKMLESVQGKALTTGQAKNLRTNLYRLAENTNNENSPIVWDIAKAFDRYMDKNLVATGDTAMKAARQATTDAKRAETLQKAFDKIPKDANAYTAYRKAADKIVKNPNELRRFTKDQQELLKRFADGNMSGRFMNGVGKFTPNANGLLGLLHVAAIGTNPFVAALTVSAYGGRAIADKKTTNAAKILVKRMGGVKEVERLAMNPEAASATQAALAQKLNTVLFGEEEEK
jgi:hypothetical protein